MKYILSIAICFIGFISAMGQQDVIFSKYTYNPMLFNPAYAGSHGWAQGTAQVQYRNQWLGIDGAPRTFLGAGEVSLQDNRAGVGMSVSTERIGVDSRVDLSANYAYRIQLETGYLAGGLRVGGALYNSNLKRIEHVDPGDIYENPSLGYQVLTAGAGLFYHQKKIYFGLSVPSIFAFSNAPGKTFKQRHYYLHMGGMIGGDRTTLTLEPSLLIKYHQAAPIQFTLGASLWYRKLFAIGAHWRSSDAFAFSAEMIFQRDYRLGISYDLTYSDLRDHSDGTIEVLLGYRFFTKSQDDIKRREWFGGRR